ncbi:copper amine oxidase N-terminal domain-containing protein [Paenibacillus sp. GCM10027628]|uniref:copper amine oxidase N-terminal domain-containing protein n=1 Tax=Paenibacillus sp. GCM10027628 TaxID=3273413 RepID=UPI00363A95FD
MKKLLLALAGLLLVSNISISMVLADSQEADPIDLTVTDDSGQNWVLKNEGAKYRLKWSFSGDSRYDHFQAKKLNDQIIILHNFSKVFAVNNQGQVIWKQDGKSSDLMTGADGSIFTFSSVFNYLDKNTTTSKATVIRFNKDGTVLSQYKDLSLALVRRKDSTFFADRFFSVDWIGNLVALIDNGLTSFRPDGTKNWQIKELKVNDKTFDVFAMNNLLADVQGNLLIGIDNQLICLNDEGKVIWAIPNITSTSRIKLSDSYLLINEKIYSVTSTGLVEENKPEIMYTISGKAIDHQGGFFQVDEKTSTLTDNDIQSGNVLWSYMLSAAERSAGYELAANFKGNFVSDDQGNVFVSTNGGTVHSLDPQGNPRFTLQIMNKIIGYSQIIPLTKNSIVIANNRNVICLEKVEDEKGGISLWLNGQQAALQHQLIMQDGRVMISLREIFEMLGAQVTWNEKQQQITAVKNDKKIIMQIGSKEAYINGVSAIFDTAPALIDDVTYVPIRYVSEALDSQVEWDNVNRIVRITALATNVSK